MYRKLILGILLAVASSATYYVVFSGGANVITNAVQNDVTPSYNTPTIEMLTGIYSCTKDRGCLGTTTLTLKDDNSVEMITTMIRPRGVSEGLELEESNIPSEGVVVPTTNEQTAISSEDLITVNEEETTIERGSWDLGSNNILIVTLTESGTSTYERYHKFIAQKVSTSTIQKITFTKDIFPSFQKPIFTREEY